ncbi:MAG: TIGR03943 family protein [Spirochaetales bacterium]|nr:TIGR03943 family protein [Spirochaetales bacterium]
MGVKRILLPIVTTLAALAVLVILVTATVNGTARTILNPRILPRTLAGAGGLAILAVWRLWCALSSPDTRSEEDDAPHSHAHGHSHVHGSSVLRRIWPLLLPLALLPASARHRSIDYGSIRLFTAGGSGIASAGPSAVTPLPATGDGSWVDDPNPALLDAVAEVAGLSSMSTERAAALDALADSSGIIVIEEDNFSRSIDLLWDAPERFAGRTVELTGFVYRRPDWPADTFVVARLSIWCCAADAAVVGLVVQVPDGHSAPQYGTWIDIRGSIVRRDEFRVGPLVMENVPELAEVAWAVVDPPEFEYVFPVVW